MYKKYLNYIQYSLFSKFSFLKHIYIKKEEKKLK